MFNILVVDDNDSIRKLIGACLEQEGYSVLCACDGAEALRLLESNRVDLMIADVMMPGMDGFSLIKDLRGANYDFPILMVTARDSFEDKREGFNAGTDDYMVKPIDMNEMLLRVNALLRRARISAERRIEIGDVALDYDALEVRTPDRTWVLPKKEFYLLFKLLSYPKKIFTRQELMEEIWGLDNETDERTVDVHIKRLREKFDGLSEFCIVTVRGLGYRAEKNV
jgi:Response regulators consisting of a CheY-like receiver domain and a winged-helix DNA-binding domain